MAAAYKVTASKKSTSLTVNGDLLEQAKNMKINISSVLEHALAETVKQKKREIWLEQNKEAIESYNKTIAEKGLFSDGMRLF